MSRAKRRSAVATNGATASMTTPTEPAPLAVLPPAADTSDLVPQPSPSPPEHPAIGRYHEHLYTTYRLMSDNYGKHLVLLSGGALTLSVTYLDKIAGPTPSYKPVVVAAWVALVACLASTLFSMQQSAEAMLAAAKGYPFEEPTKELGGAHAALVLWLNRLAALTLVVGLGLLALFALLNLRR